MCLSLHSGCLISVKGGRKISSRRRVDRTHDVVMAKVSLFEEDSDTFGHLPVSAPLEDRLLRNEVDGRAEGNRCED